MNFVFKREGEYWSIGRGDAVARLRDTKGLRYIDQLLRYPETELHALDLVTAVEGVDPDSRTGEVGGWASGEGGTLRVGGKDACEAVDAEARRAYQERLAELREEVDEAEAFNDPERAARAKEEADFLSRELAAAVGLGGRARTAISPAERARVNVTRAIKSALARLVESDEAVGGYLRATIRTGTFCSYTPLASEESSGSTPAQDPDLRVRADMALPRPDRAAGARAVPIVPYALIVMLERAVDAAACAISIQQCVQRQNEREASQRFGMHVGLSAGRESKRSTTTSTRPGGRRSPGSASWHFATVTKGDPAAVAVMEELTLREHDGGRPFV